MGQLGAWDGWRESTRRRPVAGACATNARSRARANPPLPPILGNGPSALLDLQPPSRRSRFVQACFVLRDVTFTVSRDHLRPRLEPVLREPSHRQHVLTAV